MANFDRQPPLPPPPPPPPTATAPIILGTPKVLASSQRPSTNRQHVVSVPAAQSTQRHPFAGVHPETLQHAAASLRKTQYREPLLARDSELLLGGSNELPDRRHWENIAQHAPLDQHSSRAAVHVAAAGATQRGPIRVDVQHTDPLTFRVNYNGSNNNSGCDINEPNFSSYSTYRTAHLDNNNDKKSNNIFESLPVAGNDKSNNNSNYERQVPISRNPASVQSQSFPYSNNNNSFPKNHSVVTDTNNSEQKSTYYTTTRTIRTTTSELFGDEDNHNSGKSLNNNFRTATAAPPLSSVIATKIRDPQSYINAYATGTPAAGVLQPSQQHVVATAPTPSDCNFVRELRDSGLTEHQKYSNQFQKSVIGERRSPAEDEKVIQNVRRTPIDSQPQQSDAYASVDALINDMECKMRAGVQDVCTKCGKQIVGNTPGVTALGNAYHVACFVCDMCHKQLAGCSFYNVDGQNLCQVDYMNSLEKCDKCATPITQKILRAMGKAFHPECFTCPSCGKSLDGIPFTVDKQNQAFCLDCYHERFSPRCAVCLKAIAPVGNETEVARVIAMDRSYHIDCYKCEDCGMRLNSKIEGQGCYPLESHLLCKNCNLKRLKNTYQPTTATA